jgi:hypothetical protein
VTQEQSTNTILQVNAPDKKEFQRLWRLFQPFIIKGVVDTWDAYKNWSSGYLRDKCGENELNVECLDADNYDFTNENYYQHCKMKLKDYISLTEKGRLEDIQKYYLAQLDFESNFPELIADIVYPDYLQGKRQVAFWFGFASKDQGTVCHLHYDNAHNLFSQIVGRKKFLLYPPSNYLSFYPPLGEASAYPSFSKVNPSEPDHERFPKFPWQSKIEVILEPGDMLYLPPYWWHYVTAMEKSISLSFWYDIRRSDHFKQKRLLATVINIEKQKLFG